MEQLTAWVNEFDGAVTVCDCNGVILAMNKKAAEEVFAADGGWSLIGKNIFSCHPPEAREKIKKILATQEKNIYTIEKHGKKKLIYQSPWYSNGKLQGLVEISLEIPFQPDHFVRK